MIKLIISHNMEEALAPFFYPEAFKNLKINFVNTPQRQDLSTAFQKFLLFVNFLVEIF